jgi:PAS domain S-box-containing protein
MHKGIFVAFAAALAVMLGAGGLLCRSLLQLLEDKERTGIAPIHAFTALLIFVLAAALLCLLFGRVRRDLAERQRNAHALQRERQQLRVTLLSIGDGVIVTDAHGCITIMNAVAELLTGWTRTEAVGRSISEVFLTVHEKTRKPMEGPAAQALREENTVIGLTNPRLLLSRDGTEYAVEDSAAPIRDESGVTRGVVLVFRDVTARRRAERRLAAQHAVTRLLVAPAVTGDTGVQVLRTISESLDWDLGLLWIVDDAAGVLRCTDLWQRPDVRAEAFADASFGLELAPEAGLPGRVWAGGGAAWITDVAGEESLPRWSAALHDGLHGAFGFPVQAGGAVRGVLEFFSRVARPPDDDLLRMMANLGSQFGQFLERQRIAAAERESEARKGAILHSALDGIITIDAEGRIIEFNPAAEAIFHRLQAEVLGREMAGLLLPPPLRAAHRSGLARYLVTGEGPVLNRRIETTALRADGSEFPVELTISPILTEARPLFTAFIRDITERQRAEERQRFLVEAGAVLASSLDSEETLTRMARLAVPRLADWCMVDVLTEDRQVRRIAAVHVDPAQAELVRQLQHYLTSDPNASAGPALVLRTGRADLQPEVTDALLETVVRNPEQRRLLHALGPRSFLCVPLVARGRILGALSFGIGPSSRRFGSADLIFAEELARHAALALDNARLYRELREAAERKDEFLAMLGHELRNPLAPLRNALHILRIQGPSDTILDQMRDMMERQVQHMTRLVDDLLDVARITRGKIELRLEPVELAAVVGRAAEATRALLTERHHELTMALPPEPVILNADPTRLEQVLTNLLNNAAKYTPPGGRITVAAEAAGSMVVLRVRDTGIGIRPEMLTRIFDLFTQADRVANHVQEGLGIGLTLVRRLVAMHGGTIEAHSAGPGQGSEFVVRLPRPVPAAPVNEASPAGGEDTRHPRRVLLVEDNLDGAETLAILLRLWGHDVRLAHDGSSALAAAREFRPEVVLLDIGLPHGMNGFEVAQRLRQEPESAHVLLVALTGYGQAEDRQRSRAAGFDLHLVKPVDVNALQELLTPMAGKA